MLLQAIGHVHTQWDEIMEVNGDPAMQRGLKVKLIEGDVAVEDDVQNAFDASYNKRWPNGVVPFYIAQGHERLQPVINEAIADYNKYTCIKWVQYADKAAIQAAKISNYIEFFSTGGGCWSYVGMTSLKPQKISIQWSGCARKGIVIHEMLHAIGFWHEQSRMDRDDHIIVREENIQTGKEGNFKKHNSKYYGQPYDFGSVMHYSAKAFSKNGLPTITRLDGTTNGLGQRAGLSSIDIKQINSHYECSNKPTPKPTSKPQPPPPKPTSGPGPVPHKDCGKPEVPVADMSYSNGTRVIGGKDANRGSWPWQILLLYNNRGICGGSIIGDKWVVTAAHCVFGKETGNWAIRAGEHDQKIREGSEQTITVKKVIRHPQYSPTTLNNDIALMELSKPLTFNKYVKPVCLPTADVEGKPNQYCYITGWGRTNVNIAGGHHLLQQGKLAVPSKAECNKKNSGYVTENMICGGDGGKTKLSGCYGDSGGPFVCNANGKWELHGVVSWGDGRCDSNRRYTVFSKVLANEDWIFSITGLITEPVDGNWGAWDEWSACTESCGGGTQFRTRECNNPTPENGGKTCAGVGKETRACNTDKCPPAPPGPVAGDCGKPRFPPKKSSERVIGGENAIRGSWPWQILLQYDGRAGCGGSLIRKNWVVTAAHCISGVITRPDRLGVVVGEHDRTKPETPASAKTHKVKRVVMHPKYSRRTLSNDIALLELAEDVTFNDYVKPVCLPEKEIPVESFCYITGWGKIKHPGSMTSILQQGKLKVPSNTECNSLNQATSGIKIDNTMICGGDGGDTTLSGCHGDSGGPFVCKVDGRWELHGAVSWGSGRCDSDQAYTVFSRVMTNLAWIKSYAGETVKPTGAPVKPTGKPTSRPGKPTTPFPGVNCGGHRAPSCGKCTDGNNGPLWCNGECSWCSANKQCQAKGDKCGVSYELVAKKAECDGPEIYIKNSPSVAACAETCSGKASMFAYGTNEFGNNRCSADGNCRCLCELASKDGVCDNQVTHSGYILYKYISGGGGKPTPEPTVRPTAGPDCPMKDTIFAYNNVGRATKVKTWQECAARCAADKNCFGWSWASEQFSSKGGRLKCKMKKKTFMRGKKTKANVISGAKSCTGSTTPPPPPPPPKPVTTKPPRPATTKPPQPPKPPSNQCGVQAHKTQTGKIVGGKDAAAGEFPWMVGLYGKGTAKPGRPPFCGGTLIRDNVVVTAAHCLASNPQASRYEVRIGDHDLRTGKIGSQEETVGISKIYRHENYKTGPPRNDIALLILDKKVKLGGQVQTACLPDKPLDLSAQCYASGWGTLKEGGRTQPAILQEVELPAITNEKCKQGNGNSITDDMICAGYDEGGKDACQGDSGGPFVCRIPGTDRMELRGVTSWGFGCARENKPGVYARVHYFVKNNWINNKLTEHRIAEISSKINNLETLIRSIKEKSLGGR